MRKQPHSQQDATAGPSAQSVQLPAHADPASSGLCAANPLPQTDVTGTVGATVESSDEGSYGILSDNWIREEPLCAAADASSSSAPKPCAKDLIAELDSINAQIHRIMSQVEKAVSRLATSN
jgi:hypothetical protein